MQRAKLRNSSVLFPRPFFAKGRRLLGQDSSSVRSVKRSAEWGGDVVGGTGAPHAELPGHHRSFHLWGMS